MIGQGGPIDPIVAAIVDTDAQRAWLGVATAVALYGAKKILDAMLPRGYVFRFMARFIDRGNGTDGGRKRGKDD